MLTPIKLLLIVPLILLVVLFITKLRNRTFYRVTFIVIGILGILFVLNPDLTMTIAHRLDVGRGTDLLLYLSVVAGLVGMSFLYSRLRKMEATQTDIIRNAAISSAKQMKQAP